MRATTSLYVLKKKSSIHNFGIFAKKDIPKGAKIIEYVGEKITKCESDRRGADCLHHSRKNKERGSVYIFELNKRHDLDGNVSYNTAKYINHSCHPNSEAHLIHGHIWIVALKDIKKEKELSYNYGYGFEDYHEHECRCGAHNCVGYILDKEHWPKLKREQLLEKNGKTHTSANCRKTKRKT